MEKNELEIKTQYFEITDLWKCLCEKHSELLDKTFDEYQCLLNSEIEQLDQIITNKEKVIKEISVLEKNRAKIVSQIVILTGVDEVNHFEDLLSLLKNHIPEEREQRHLFRFNKLLIDIIEKIQDQNKKNQLFLNKALLSLKIIREQFSGTASYQTYTQNGAKVTSTRA